MGETQQGERRRAERHSMVDREGVGVLSAREQQVLSYAAAGYIDKQIGVAMGVSLNTLRTYWQRIRSKMGEAPRAALAVAYVEHVAAQSHAHEVPDPDHDWEIDLARDTIRRVSHRPARFDAEVGQEMPLDVVLAAFHPEDQPRIRALLVSIKRGEHTAFNYVARMFTPTGIVDASAFIQVERDSDGRPVRALGRRAEIVDLRAPQAHHVEIGYWERDLMTGQFNADEGFLRIFRLEPGPRVRERAFARFHPEEVARCRRFVDDAVRAGKTRDRATHRLVFEDGATQWVTTDMRIEREHGKPVKALGMVMAFD